MSPAIAIVSKLARTARSPSTALKLANDSSRGARRSPRRAASGAVRLNVGSRYSRW